MEGGREPKMEIPDEGLGGHITVMSRRGLLGVLAVVVAIWLGPFGSAYGQPPAQPVQRQGTLGAVDCQNLTFVLNTPDGQVGYSATAWTGIYAGEQRLPEFCLLKQYPGAGVAVWSIAVDGRNIAGRIVVLVFPGAALVPVAAADAEVGGDRENGSGGGGVKEKGKGKGHKDKGGKDGGGRGKDK